MEDYRCRRRQGIVTARHNHINPGLSNIARTLFGVRQPGISPGWKSLCPPNHPLHWYKLDRCHEGLFYDQHLLSGLCDDHSVAQRYIPGGACFPPLPIQCTLESVPTKPKDPRWATRATYAKDRTKIFRSRSKQMALGRSRKNVVSPWTGQLWAHSHLFKESVARSTSA